MSIPLSPRTILPTSGRRHFTDDAVARREAMELQRYQQQLEATSRAITPQGAPLSPPSNKTSIPNSILAHYTDEATEEDRVAKRKAAAVLSSRDDAAARALQSKLLEDKIRAEQLAQMELNRQIKAEEARQSRDLDMMMNANAAEATRVAKSQSTANRQRAKDVGSYQLSTAEEERRGRAAAEAYERARDKEAAEYTAEEFRREQRAKKEGQRSIALADQRLWEKQRELQAVKNSPSKSLTPREQLRRHAEEGAAAHEELALYQRLQDARVEEEQRQQEEKVFRQLALISATAKGTVKMTTPRQNNRLAAIDSMKKGVGMIERLDDGDKARAARSDAFKKGDARHHEAAMASSSSGRRPVQNGLHSWGTEGSQLASSRRTDGAARAFEEGATMVDRLAHQDDVDRLRRREEGQHVQGVQRLQADQRKLKEANERGLEREQRLAEDNERRAQDDALQRHLDSVLNAHGVSAGSPKAARLRPIDSPRRNPGPGAYGNYESRSSPLKRL